MKDKKTSAPIFCRSNFPILPFGGHEVFALIKRGGFKQCLCERSESIWIAVNAYQRILIVKGFIVMNDNVLLFLHRSGPRFYFD